MKSVEYLLRVTSPSDRFGYVGQIRHDLPDNAVDDLVASGHVKITKTKAVAKGTIQHEKASNRRSRTE